MARREAVLNFFAHRMHHGSWRDPEEPSNLNMDVQAWQYLARTAERGKLHSVFIADASSLAYADGDAEFRRRSSRMLHLEPLTLGASVATVTERIGVMVTASTTYSLPYQLARGLATLDIVSGGRAGWNVVTSHMPAAAANFGMTSSPDHGTRYEMAEEFFNVVKGLWDSVEDDALILDEESGIFIDPDKIHELNHHGPHLSVKGPLNIVRPPQGHPVIAQAGASAEGKAFAARNAEVMFMIQEDVAKAREFYAEMKGAAEANGRDPDHLKILPGLNLVMGRTEEEAKERLARMNALVDPVVGLNQLNQFLDFDLTGYPLDGPLPDDIPLTEQGRSRQQHLIRRARENNSTIRELIEWAGGVGTFAGWPEGIADTIEEWISTDACDGFNLMFADQKVSLEIFVELVVPELQRRGLFHNDYRGQTLRENLGLPRPANQFVA